MNKVLAAGIGINLGLAGWATWHSDPKGFLVAALSAIAISIAYWHRNRK